MEFTLETWKKEHIDVYKRQTVYNAMNGSSLVTEETREKVMEAAKKLNYVPNMNGRFLKSGRSRQLCFITSSISGEYFYRLTDSMNAECEKNGYCLNIVVTRDKNCLLYTSRCV